MSLDLDLSLETLIAWKRKPYAMVEDLFGAKPDPWQREALEAFRNRAEIALQTSLTTIIRLNDRSSSRQPVQPPGIILDFGLEWG